MVKLGSRGTGIVAVALACTAASAASDGDLGFEVVRHRLGNGMTVLMVERHDTPTVATYLQFDVGAVDDPKGQSGIAHLLEHMMFKGTETFGTSSYEAEKPLIAELDRLWAELDTELAKERSPFLEPNPERLVSLRSEIERVSAEQKQYIIKNELWQGYQRLGGTGLNASTGSDSTQYFVQLPSNQLPVWAYLEADRIKNPVFREFYSERDVVHEERRLRTDTQPRSLFQEAFQNAAFIAHPYRNPVVGFPSDIDSTVRAEVLEHFRSFYAPNNCVAAIVGDIDVAKTVALMEQTFGTVPSKLPPRRNVTEEPEHTGERRFTMKLEAAPQIQIGYLVPAAGEADVYPLVVASRVLGESGGGGGGGGRGFRRGGGGTGRLYKSLVLGKQVALNASARLSPGKYPGLLVLSATPAPDVAMADLEAALTAEVERLAKEPPTADELARVRNAEDASLIRQLRSNSGIASAIGRAEVMAGDWRYLLRARDAIKAVSAEAVSSASGKYLVANRRTVGWLEGTDGSMARRGAVEARP